MCIQVIGFVCLSRPSMAKGIGRNRPKPISKEGIAPSMAAFTDYFFLAVLAACLN